MAAGARAQDLALLLGTSTCSVGASSSLVTVMASTSAKAATAMLRTVSAKKNANGSCSPARARIRRATTRPDRAFARGSWPVQLLRRRLRLRLRAQLLPGAPRPRASPSAGTSPATTGAQTGSKPAGLRSESGVELGHHLPAHNRSRDLAVSLPGDRRLEPQSGGLGRC